MYDFGLTGFTSIYTYNRLPKKQNKTKNYYIINSIMSYKIIINIMYAYIKHWILKYIFIELFYKFEYYKFTCIQNSTFEIDAWILIN